MSRDHQFIGSLRGLAAALLLAGALAAAGCADFQKWWNQQLAGGKNGQQEATPETLGAVRIDESAAGGSRESSAAAESAATTRSPDSLEQRIREHVQRFPADDDNRKIHAPPRAMSEEEPAVARHETPSTGLPMQAPAHAAAVRPIAPDADSDRAAVPVAIPPEAPETSAAESQQDVSRAGPALPVVESVTVTSAGREPESPPDTSPEATGQVNQPLRMQEQAERRTVETAVAELERLVASQPDDIASQLRLRMLYLAQGQDDRALSPIEGVNRDVAEMVHALMEVVVASREATADPAAKADEMLQAVNAYREMIKDYAELQIPRVALCTEAISFGVYKPYPPDRLVSGQTTPVVVYCEVKNFTSKRTPDEEYQTLLRWQVEVLDADGQLVATASDKSFEDRSRNRREDFFLADIVHLQSDLQPGEYTLRVQIEDRLSGRFGSGSTGFTIRAAGA